MLKQGDPWDTPFVSEYLNRPDVKEALHIPAKVSQPFSICNDTIIEVYKSRIDASAWIYKEMMTNYKLMHYSGNSDGAVPTSGTRAWITKMGLKATTPERNYTTSTNSNYTG